MHGEFSQIAIIRLDAQGHVTQINKTGCQLIGYEAAEIIGQSWVHLCVPTPLWPQVNTELKTLVKGSPGGPDSGESTATVVERKIPIVTKSGDERLLAWRQVPLGDNEGAVAGVLLLGLDVTEQQKLRAEVAELRLELAHTAADLAKMHEAAKDDPKPSHVSQSTQERMVELQESNRRLMEHNSTLQQENRELARANAELDSFVHIAFHDLREPLRNISQYVRFLEEDHEESLDEEGLEMLDSIRQQSDHLANLLDDLRIYAVINYAVINHAVIGRSRNDTIGPVDLNALVHTVLEQLSALITEQGARVEIREPLPTLACSASHISTVFQNLIANAIKYNDKVEKCVEISCDVVDDNPVFCVSDNGIGIDSRYTERIFEMFRRLHGQNEYGGGTGAGLAIVKKCIESTGGRIWLESKEGVGTKFYFTIGQPE